jgi:hypothetical protein
MILTCKYNIKQQKTEYCSSNKPRAPPGKGLNKNKYLIPGGNKDECF